MDFGESDKDMRWFESTKCGGGGSETVITYVKATGTKPEYILADVKSCTQHLDYSIESTIDRSGAVIWERGMDYFTDEGDDIHNDQK